jgi:mannose-6-phosphate isomerase-like protein (cupin superfamily)
MNKEIRINATGEAITFLKTGKETNGEYVETIVRLPASGQGPRTHRHVFQTEYFEAIDGNLGLDCGDQKIVLRPGESFTVPKNTLHRCYSVDGREIEFKAIFRPALSIEYLLTEMFESSNRINSPEPTAFDAIYIIRQTNDEYFLGDFSEFFQRNVFPLIVSVGRIFRLIKAKPNPDKK